MEEVLTGELQLTLRTLISKQVAGELWNHEKCGRMRNPLTRVGTQQWELCQHVKGKRDAELQKSWYPARARNGQDPCPLPVSMLTASVPYPLSLTLCPGLRCPGIGRAGISEHCVSLLPRGCFSYGTPKREDSGVVVMAGDVKGS